eukprot:12424907-Karenia_brevis.AAC.1
MDSFVPVHVIIGQKEHFVGVRCVEQYKHLGTSMSLSLSIAPLLRQRSAATGALKRCMKQAVFKH